MAEGRTNVPIDDETRELLIETRHGIDPTRPLSYFTRNALPIGLGMLGVMDKAMKDAEGGPYYPAHLWNRIADDVEAFVRKTVTRYARENPRPRRGKGESDRA